MSDLRIIINYQNNSAVFAGKGTFNAKEQIKELGGRWQNLSKTWEIKPLTCGVEKLQNIFPGALIEKIDTQPGDELIVDATNGQDVKPEIAAVISAPGSATQSINSSLPAHQGVSEFLNKVKKVLQNSFNGVIYICGMVNKVTDSKGRKYIDLEDIDNKGDCISCVVWEWQQPETVFASLTQIGFELEANLPILIQAKVDLNNKKGQLSLNITGVLAEYTLGKLKAERDITNQKLKTEGLFDKQKQLTLPLPAKRLGILTSSAGTVINDLRAGLETAKFGFELFWCDVSVQGNSAVQEIIQGLKYFSLQPNIDAILLFRGGGSQSELAVFNDYKLARAICLCPKPVVSAIGHEADMSSTQDVSFIACGVPKSIGLYFANLILEIKNKFNTSVKTINNKAIIQLETYNLKIKNIKETFPEYIKALISRRESLFRQLVTGLPAWTRQFLKFENNKLLHLISLERDIKKMLELKNFDIALKLTELCRDIKKRVEFKELTLEHFYLLIENVSPQKQLKRGFSLVRKNNKFVTNVEQLNVSDNIEIEFHNGKSIAVVSLPNKQKLLN
ncbi:MAG: exodeoxyribonuclease VII large subunit [Deltaproteobacteria bacterium]|jgi:exodeoxyribonuclease VII large subunit|nr:exodeoxyribonuclease VII large subunit [Deltaproteobacteria bacterium]